MLSACVQGRPGGERGGGGGGGEGDENGDVFIMSLMAVMSWKTGCTCTRACDVSSMACR